MAKTSSCDGSVKGPITIETATVVKLDICMWVPSAFVFSSPH